MLKIKVTIPDGQGGYTDRQMTMMDNGGRKEIRSETGDLMSTYTRTDMPIDISDPYGKLLSSAYDPDGQPLGTVYNNGLMKDEGDVIANMIQWVKDRELKVYPASIGIQVITEFDDQTALEEAFAATCATYLAFYRQVRAL